MIDQGRNVLGPFPQRGDGQGDDVQLEIEVFPKLVLADELLQALGRGGHETHIDRHGFRRPGREEGLVFDDAHQLGLAGQAHVPDLVEEDRASGGQLQFALPLPDGLGRAALGRAEEVHLQEVGRHRGAVDLDEAFVGAPAVLMDEAGDELLARAVFAGDEDAAGGGGGLLHVLTQPQYGRAGPHQMILELEPLPELKVLLFQPELLQGVLDGQDDLLQGQGLFQKVEGPQLDGLDGRLHRAVAGDHHHLGMVFQVLDFPQHLQAAHPGQPDVEQDQVEVLLVELLEALLAGLHRQGLVAFVFQDAFQCGADGGFVVDDQDLFSAHAGISMMNLAPVGRLLWTSIVPSCSRTIWSTMASPRPVPFFLVEK